MRHVVAKPAKVFAFGYPARYGQTMTTPLSVKAPDFNQMAGRFDRFLPLIHPVSLAILDHLPDPAAGATVLDVACGTGEPGLTLARRSPGIHLFGVDAAPAMIDVARGKASGEGLANTRFEVMSSEALAISDGGVDAVISRFGLMLFGDVAKSALELARVLRKGGGFSFAVWDEMTKNTLVYTATMVVAAHVPKEHEMPLNRLNEWAVEGLRTRLLEEAGITSVRTEMFGWPYSFDSFEDVWGLVSGMASVTGQAALPPETQEKIQVELLAALSEYKQSSGGYVIPHACRLFWGER